MTFREVGVHEVRSYNWLKSRFVLLELKIGQFSPNYIGQLGLLTHRADEDVLTGTADTTPDLRLPCGRNR